MNAAALEIFDRCVRAGVALSRRGEKLHAEALGRYPAPPDLLADLADHKADVLALLDYMAEAEALLLESTRALAAAWPAGCDLGDDWDLLEAEVHAAYWALDLGRLRSALADRDRYALLRFDAHRAAWTIDPT